MLLVANDVQNPKSYVLPAHTVQFLLRNLMIECNLFEHVSSLENIFNYKTCGMNIQ